MELTGSLWKPQRPRRKIAIVDRTSSSGTSTSLDATNSPRWGITSRPSGPLVTGSTWRNLGERGSLRSSTATRLPRSDAHEGVPAAVNRSHGEQVDDGPNGPGPTGLDQDHQRVAYFTPVAARLITRLKYLCASLLGGSISRD